MVITQLLFRQIAVIKKVEVHYSFLADIYKSWVLLAYIDLFLY